MRIEALLTPEPMGAAQVRGSTVIVIDVIRATTCIVEAVAAGARAIFPVESTEKAMKLASSLDRENTLLCGERRGLRIEGFDLGNSPAEFTPARVAGKQLIMSTTNGTLAFLSATLAKRVLAASFLNLSAVVEAVDDDEHVVVVCAGKEGRFSLDDALCAGHIIRRVVAANEDEPVLNDAAVAAAALAEGYHPSEEVLACTAAGRQLAEVGLDSDLCLCAHVDKHAIVPVMRDRVIAAARG